MALRQFIVALTLVSFLAAAMPVRASEHAEKKSESSEHSSTKEEHASHGLSTHGWEVENPFVLFDQHQLDEVGTLDVAACWAIVSLTVATVGKAAQAAANLGKLGRAIHHVDTVIETSIGNWILLAKIPGLTAAQAEGLGVLLLKVAEVSGFLSARQLTKAAMIKLVWLATKAMTSCSKVAQVYYDGITKIPGLIFPKETVCNGNFQKYIDCQKTCGSSLSQATQSSLYAAFVPDQCWRTPLADKILSTLAESYRRSCYEHYCSGETTYYTNRHMTKFSQCSQKLDKESVSFLDYASALCEKARTTTKFLGTDSSR